MSGDTRLPFFQLDVRGRIKIIFLWYCDRRDAKFCVSIA